MLAIYNSMFNNQLQFFVGLLNNFSLFCKVTLKFCLNNYNSVWQEMYLHQFTCKEQFSYFLFLPTFYESSQADTF